MSTRELNPIRNHLDRMKGGRISRYFHPARMIHIIAIDPGTYEQRMYQNFWLQYPSGWHNFSGGLESLRHYDALDAVPVPVRKYLERGDPRQETVKAAEFEKMSFRIFGIMPGYYQSGKLPAAMKKAEELGFKAIVLADKLIESRPVRQGSIWPPLADTIEGEANPSSPPARFSPAES